MKNACDYLVNKITNDLLKENAVCMEEADVYRFGVEVTILKMLHFLSYLIIAVCMGKVKEFIVIFFIFYAFRRNTGGFHAKTRTGCYIFSCIAIIMSLMATEIEISYELMVGLVLCELAVLFFISPIRNENRPLDTEEIDCFRRRFYLFSALFIVVYIVTELAGYHQLVILYTVGLTLDASLAVLGKIQELGQKDI